jgi:hypothetical protein
LETILSKSVSLGLWVKSKVLIQKLRKQNHVAFTVCPIAVLSVVFTRRPLFWDTGLSDIALPLE